MGWRKLLRIANRAASVATDVEVLATGDPDKIAKRAENKLKAKILRKIGFWK